MVEPVTHDGRLRMHWVRSLRWLARATRAGALGLALVAVAHLTVLHTQAHRLDECLAASLIRLEPDRVRIEVHLTPGIEVAPKLLASIDTNRDGTISVAEGWAQGEALGRKLDLRIDGKRVPLNLEFADFPDATSFRSGEAAAILVFEARIDPVKPGPHVATFRNRNRPPKPIYLANAVLPMDRSIAVNGQERNRNQSRLQIRFTKR